MNDSTFGVNEPVPAPLSGHRGADRLMSAARLVLDLHVRGMGSRPGPPPPPPTPPTIDCRIVDKSVVAEHAIKLVLAADDGARLPTWDPGAHVDLYLPSGLIRQYSLCGAHPSAPPTR